MTPEELANLVFRLADAIRETIADELLPMKPEEREKLAEEINAIKERK